MYLREFFHTPKNGIYTIDIAFSLKQKRPGSNQFNKCTYLSIKYVLALNYSRFCSITKWIHKLFNRKE